MQSALSLIRWRFFFNFFLTSGLCMTAGILPKMVEEPEWHDQGYGEGAHQFWTAGVNVCSFKFCSCHSVDCIAKSYFCSVVNGILLLVLKKWWHVHAWWGGCTLHWHDRSDYTWTQVHQGGVWPGPTDWLANWSVWALCSSGLPSWRRSNLLLPYPCQVLYHLHDTMTFCNFTIMSVSSL